MDTRRRSAKSGLITSLAVSLLLCMAGAQANVRLQLQPGHDKLRFEVPDALYAAGISADFSGLRIQGADGRDLAFAVCPISQSQLQRQAVSVMAVPDLARPRMLPDDSLGTSRPAGAGPVESVDAWILDLRSLQGNIRELHGLPAIRSLKLSPNLQQWSGEITFQQTNDSISIEPRPANFVRLVPQEETAWNATPPHIEVTSEAHSGRRQPHWFQPQQSVDNTFINARALPIIAARLPAAIPDQGWQLQSRQGRGDAWKPRARFVAGERQQQLRFSAVTDPQWRVLGTASTALQLAHAAHDIRLPQVPTDAPLQLIFEPEQRNGPSLSCPGTAQIPPQAPTQISVLNENSQGAPHSPFNVRTVFLIVLGSVLTLVYLLRRYLLRRRAG